MHTEARSRWAALSSAMCPGSAGVSITTVSPEISTVHPRCLSTSAIAGTSEIEGQLVSVVRPSAIRATAINLRTLFLAPATEISPDSRVPPLTRKLSSRDVGLPLTGPP